MKNLRGSQGFSLLEILVVLVIVGMLAGLVITNVVGRGEKAKVSAAKAQIQLVTGQIETYYLDNGRLPDRLDQLVPDYAKANQLKDPWGNDWQYRVPGQNGNFDLFSYGGDNSPGGEGTGVDVNSWD